MNFSGADEYDFIVTVNFFLSDSCLMSHIINQTIILKSVSFFIPDILSLTFSFDILKLYLQLFIGYFKATITHFEIIYVKRLFVLEIF